MSKISTVSFDEVEPYLFRYKLIEEIGRGAFATTFKAIKNGEIFAIKILDPLRANMQRRDPEICALKKINSPYVVKLYEEGSFTRGKIEYPYLVCEYIEGISLEKLIKSKKVFSYNSLVTFCWAIAQGLDHIWRHQIIHRDLKPANILLDKTRRGIPKIIDFGFARHLGKGPKDPDNSPGTPLYMAPEQIREGKKVDIRADLFALGIILYQMACGIHPFETEESVKSIRKNICTITPALPSSYNEKLEGDMEEIIIKLLKKKPKKRFQNPRELLVALKDMLKRKE